MALTVMLLNSTSQEKMSVQTRWKVSLINWSNSLSDGGSITFEILLIACYSHCNEIHYSYVIYFKSKAIPMLCGPDRPYFFLNEKSCVQIMRWLDTTVLQNRVHPMLLNCTNGKALLEIYFVKILLTS